MGSDLILREPRTKDVLQIRELRRKFHKDGFELPPLDQIVSDAVVLDKDKVIAYGTLKILAEAILIMDHSMSQKLKVQALTLLIQEAVKAASDKRIKEVQAICEPKFAAVMTKQFGFRKLLGETLVIEV